ncbi:1404_t:CDS:2 [Entrophospora sp. SA101]|nr:1404_t:CDS:2 [Entrophospora sp. SA101]
MLNILKRNLTLELFTEIEQVKELQTVNSELQILHQKQEKLNKSKFKWLTNESKIKQIEQKIVDCLSQIEKLNKEVEERKIELIAQGGFGKVEKAKDYNKNYQTVALKTLTNSQQLNQEFLTELTLYKMFKSEVSNMVPCYGISRDNEGNYIMVMKYMAAGNLREYLRKNYRELKFYSNEYGESSKLLFLKQISQGLKDIHRKNLVHRDFHSGNIIVGGSSCHIIDLGLAKPANETDDSKVFGVIPYVAPEVLQNKPYNPASDIYSLGIIMYELITCLPPYVEQAHDVDLVLKICQGERPSFSNPKTTQQEPNNRPTAKEVSRIVGEWFNEYGNLKTDTEFYHQYQAAEEFNKTIPEEIKYPTYQSQEQLAKLKLVEPQHGTKDLELDINNFNLDELTIQEDPQEQSSTQAQIEIPLNKTSVQLTIDEIRSIDNAKNLFELRNAVAKLEATNPPPATPADAELQKKGEIPFMAQPEVKDYKREVKELSFVPDYNKGEIRVEYVYGEPKKQAVNYTIQADKGERLQSIDPDNIPYKFGNNIIDSFEQFKLNILKTISTDYIKIERNKNDNSIKFKKVDDIAFRYTPYLKSVQRPDGTEYYPMCPNITSYLADVETLIKDLELYS